MKSTRQMNGTILGLALGLLSPIADAAVVEYSDQSSFISDTSANLQSVPNVGGISAVTTTGGLLTVALASAGGIYTGTSSGFNVVNFVGKSGTEDFNIAVNSAAIYAFGLTVYESTSTAVTGCNWNPCVDSTFTFRLFSGANLLGAYTITPDDNVYDFYGYWSSAPITKIEIRDVTANVDNEFFGRFYTGATAYSAPPVPLPAAGWLMLSGLGGLGFLGRRNKAA